MYCPNCGIQLPDNAEFCSNCGTKLANAKSFAVSRTKPNWWIPVIIVLGVAFVVVAVIGFLGLFDKALPESISCSKDDVSYTYDYDREQHRLTIQQSGKFSQENEDYDDDWNMWAIPFLNQDYEDFQLFIAEPEPFMDLSYYLADSKFFRENQVNSLVVTMLDGSKLSYKFSYLNGKVSSCEYEGPMDAKKTLKFTYEDEAISKVTIIDYSYLEYSPIPDTYEYLVTRTKAGAVRSIKSDGNDVVFVKHDNQGRISHIEPIYALSLSRVFDFSYGGNSNNPISINFELGSHSAGGGADNSTTIKLKWKNNKITSIKEKGKHGYYSTVEGEESNTFTPYSRDVTIKY